MFSLFPLTHYRQGYTTFSGYWQPNILHLVSEGTFCGWGKDQEKALSLSLLTPSLFTPFLPKQEIEKYQK